MEGALYLLCAATALVCSILLLRSYLRSRLRLLLWCACFFLALVLENVILFVDQKLGPTVDLASVRVSMAFLGTTVLLYGLVCETK